MLTAPTDGPSQAPATQLYKQRRAVFFFLLFFTLLLFLFFIFLLFGVFFHHRFPKGLQGTTRRRLLDRQ
jgi:hypothetical protein